MKTLTRMLLLAAILPLAFACGKDDSEGPKRVDAAAAITDPAFKSYCLQQFDKNADGQLSEEEILAVDVIVLDGTSGDKIVSLEGINGFRNLTSLVCTHHDLTAFEASGLEKLHTIDLSSNTALVQVKVERMPALTRFDLNNCASLETLEVKDLPQVEEFEIPGSLIKTLSVSGLQKLIVLNCSQKPVLETVIISDMGALTTVYSNDDPMLRAFKIDSAPVLQALNLNRCTSLESYEVTNLPLLNSLSLANTNIKNVTLSGFKSLVTLNCSQMKEVVTVEISDMPLLEKFYINDNPVLKKVSGLGLKKLTTFFFTNCPEMESLTLSGLPLTNIDNWDAAYFPKLKKMSFKDMPSLQTFNVDYPTLQYLELANLPALSVMQTSESGIETLSLAGFEKMDMINISQSPNLTSVNFSDMPVLKTIYANNSPMLKEMVLSETPQVKLILLSNSPLTTFDTTKLYQLEDLTCGCGPGKTDLTVLVRPTVDLTSDLNLKSVNATGIITERITQRNVAVNGVTAVDKN